MRCERCGKRVIWVLECTARTPPHWEHADWRGQLETDCYLPIVVGPRAPAWALDPAAVNRARLVALVMKALRLREIVRFLNRHLP